MSRIRLLALAALVIALAVPAFAQGTNGVLEGEVKDDQGLALQGAAVSARNTETGFNRSTTTDAGGPLEFVDDGVNGLVAQPEPDALAGAIARLASDAGEAARLGDAGHARARVITWDGVVEQLMQAACEGAPSVHSR